MSESTQMLPPPRCYLACRYSAQMLRGRLYTPDHYWLQEESPGRWRVGLTPWVVRLLGVPEKYRLDLAAGAPARLGAPLGALEGRHTVVKIRAAAAGTLVHANPLLTRRLDVLSHDCCGTGWLYLIQGTPDPAARAVTSYRQWLEEAIAGICGAGPTMQ